MKRLTLLGILSLIVSLVFLSNRYAALTGEFIIDPSSQLRLEGVTNVNRFSCDCSDNFPKDTYELIQDNRPFIINLRNTDFRLATNKLDCGRKGINNDLRKALKADSFPFIRIEVQTIRLPEGAGEISSTAWTEIPVKTQITIAGTRRPLHLSVEAKALGDDYYQLRSRTEVAMSDFGIDPPRPMFGMIKVEDVITIHFDLKVHLLT
ncbi:YceI family protein [Flavilitoribacter nigricans]|uniref:Lipid/polyisoprenoid-binding YceI-like domain-containing protein n=1 Tax=Flavilitoribacter nigricans (strain ATCC 23147 / DSM 23189 / NBRC 102662 / NCIMB 1420 / SS-2) TaxID=1122177 RepID=A0A2D0NFR2_FLAN2|nr:YceI family protein [Flavilitoribacter nigricans]PHN07325.1 hypothetical protein CRP01_06755 [Flavilitoribacter nigricans DSM 23189 = NBRC 102662]